MTACILKKNKETKDEKDLFILQPEKVKDAEVVLISLWFCAKVCSESSAELFLLTATYYMLQPK